METEIEKYQYLYKDIDEKCLKLYPDIPHEKYFTYLSLVISVSSNGKISVYINDISTNTRFDLIKPNEHPKCLIIGAYYLSIENSIIPPGFSIEHETGNDVVQYKIDDNIHTELNIIGQYSEFKAH